MPNSMQEEEPRRRGRASGLVSFLFVERTHRSIHDQERRDLECSLIAFAFAITTLLYIAPAQAGIFLNLYFLPVSISAFYLGRYRAGMAAALCILCSVYVIGTSTSASITLLELASWCGVLTLTALFIGTLSDEVNSRFDRVFEDHVSETRTDALTRVANRRSFDIELQHELAELKEHGTPFCLVFVDIDFFKRFNDTYGHQAGDKVLHDVARSLESTVRNSDVVFRYGGEEFAVLMPNVGIQDGLNVSERVRRDIEATRYFHDRVKLRLTVSVGITEGVLGDDEESVVRRADEALYTSKQEGRNCVHYDTGEGCEHFGAPLQVMTCDRRGEDQVIGSQYEDSVTGLPSRRVFISELYRRLSESERYGSSFSIVMLRIDSLDELEAMGDPVVQMALTVVSELTRGVMRDTDLIVRYSTDSFAILMPSTTVDQAIVPVGRLLEEISECDSMRYKGNVIHLGADAGIAEPTGEDASGLIERAIEQMGSDSLVFASRAKAPTTTNVVSHKPSDDLSDKPRPSAG